MAELFLGLMSGTSMDGVDAVLVDCGGSAAPRVIAGTQRPFDETAHRQLVDLAAGGGSDALEQLTRLDFQLGHLFADAALALLEQAGIDRRRVRAIGSHGQTVLHRPDGTAPTSLQIGDPNIIAERTGITTVADFRRRDMAAGGQGAPLVPAFHCAVFHKPGRHTTVLNIGGIANITVMPPTPDAHIGGFDTGPGNTLMDAWIMAQRGQRMDEHGDWAARGQVHADLLACLLADPYFDREAPKTTGREYFNIAWLRDRLAQLQSKPSPVDVQTTLCELTARTIAHAIDRFAPDSELVIACGGGVYNRELLRRLVARLRDTPLETAAQHGIAPEWVEATAFAWLASQTLEGRAGNLPTVTGARHGVVLGGIYYGKVASGE